MELNFSRFEIATGTGALFVCLVFVCVFVEAAPIRDEIAAGAAGALNQQDLYWSAVEARGQHLLLTGAAANAASRDKALQAAAAVRGVTGVEDRIAVIGDAGRCQHRVDAVLGERRVTFKAGRPELSDSSYAVLAAVARVMKNCRATFEVASHTDASGDAVINLKLSQRRAEAAARYLVESGVAPEQLTATGYGESQPVADNASAAGRAANARLEFRILGANA